MKHSQSILISRAAIALGIMLLGVINFTRAQDQNFIAIIPALMDRTYTDESETPLQMTQQRFFVQLYHNAAAVYSESDFVNTADDTLTAELALPSTGYSVQNHTSWGYTSNGLLGLRFWVAGERVEPEAITDEPVEWYTIKPVFPPGETTKIKVLFWVQTSLTDVDSASGLDTVVIQPGERGLVIDISDATRWKDAISTVEATVIMKEGLTPKDTLFVDPDDYETTDSTLTWNLVDVEPSLFDNILIRYDAHAYSGTVMQTMEDLDAFITHEGYDELLEYIGRMDEE